MRRFLILMFLVLLPPACAEDKSPGFPAQDLPTVDGEGGVEDEEEEDSSDGSCRDHSDCGEDELCHEGACEDRDTALSDCEEDGDCPDGFVCVEEQCEED